MACGGSGGGKPDSAMGGGKDILKLDNALALVDEFVAAHESIKEGRTSMDDCIFCKIIAGGDP